MDGMMYDAFKRIYARGATARTLAASILFKMPGMRLRQWLERSLKKV